MWTSLGVNSGPAAAEGEFAASVMRQLRRPTRLCSRQDVAAEDQDEIAQDSFCMLTHRQGRFWKVVDFGINTTAAAVGQSRKPDGNDETFVTCHVGQYTYLFLAVRNRKRRNCTTTRTRTCSYRGASSRGFFGEGMGENRSFCGRCNIAVFFSPNSIAMFRIPPMFLLT